MVDQCRKPQGWMGRFQLWSMNSRHSKLTDWGLTRVSIRPDFHILDIGCGGGRTIGKLAAAVPEGKVYGIDHSEESVAASIRNNAQGIERGRVEIQQASVSALPFANGAFDLITAVETHYFWPDLAADMREVFRVLKSGGRFIMIAEAYRGAQTATAKLVERYLPLTGMALLTTSEHHDLCTNAGFVDVQVIEKPKKGWIVSVGKKP
jgi:SAM-dependent methyltransferase